MRRATGSTVVRGHDVRLGDGRRLHAYDTGRNGPDGRLVVVWHHGTPNVGAPPEPLGWIAKGIELAIIVLVAVHLLVD